MVRQITSKTACICAMVRFIPQWYQKAPQEAINCDLHPASFIMQAEINSEFSKLTEIYFFIED
jgi:hypothetical protein